MMKMTRSLKTSERIMQNNMIVLRSYADLYKIAIWVNSFKANIQTTLFLFFFFAKHFKSTLLF